MVLGLHSIRVVFSIRHVEVKLFLAVDPLVINAFRSIALLCGIGSVGPPMMGPEGWGGTI
jgi:hypothetical protein